MPIYDLFSKRKKRADGKQKDVYQYEDVPEPLRVQIVHIWDDVLGKPDERYQYQEEVYKFIHDALCREYGLFRLTNERDIPYVAVVNYLLTTPDTQRVLDLIELSFKTIDVLVRSDLPRYQTTGDVIDDAILELNERFREHAVGYQYESQQLVRIDSQIVHAEVVKPALQLLSQKELKGANEEFLSAHTHYRHKKYKECLNDCLKAFESVLKVICTKHRWSFKPTDTAKTLLEVIFANELIPTFMQSHFTGLRATLEAGVPTARNKLSGHGQGTQQHDVPEYLAAYILHLTASNIVFLVRASQEVA